MSRSGYSDDCEDPLAIGRWRAAVKSAINGKRGQAMLRDLLAALDAMPKKRLAANSLVNAEGEYCTLGVLGAKRGIDLESLDPEDYAALARHQSEHPDLWTAETRARADEAALVVARGRP